MRVKRNDTVHALWAIIAHPEGSPPVPSRRPGEFDSVTIKARGSLNIKIRRTTVGEIDDISEEVIAFAKRLAEFVEVNISAET